MWMLHRYIAWIRQTYPTLQSGGIASVLERCCCTFQRDERYRSDVRFLRVWLSYVGHPSQMAVAFRLCQKEAKNSDFFFFFFLLDFISHRPRCAAIPPTCLPSCCKTTLARNTLCCTKRGLLRSRSSACFRRPNKCLRAPLHGKVQADCRSSARWHCTINSPTARMLHRNAMPIDRLKRSFASFQRRVVIHNANAADQLSDAPAAASTSIGVVFDAFGANRTAATTLVKGGQPSAKTTTSWAGQSVSFSSTS